jgi:hypothetical protein
LLVYIPNVQQCPQMLVHFWTFTVNPIRHTGSICFLFTRSFNILKVYTAVSTHMKQNVRHTYCFSKRGTVSRRRSTQSHFTNC